MIEPLVGRTRFVIESMSVVLPAPLGPMTKRTSCSLQREVEAVDRVEGVEGDDEVADLQQAGAHHATSFVVAVAGAVRFATRGRPPLRCGMRGPT